MPNKEISARANMCAVETDLYLDRHFRPDSTVVLTGERSREMETAKMAVALKIIGFDTVGDSARTKVREMNVALTKNGVRFFDHCMKGDPLLIEMPKVPNQKPYTAPQQHV